MPEKKDIREEHFRYNRIRYSWRQVRDCIEGSNSIKRANQVYLPLPSGMNFNSATTPDFNNEIANFSKNTIDYEFEYVPWEHSNPAYSAYLQRARFPEMTNHSLMGFAGVATRQEPQINLPAGLEYLEENATADGLSLNELFEFCVSEIFQTGKLSLVLDMRAEDNTFYIAPYNAESNIDWNTSFANGKRRQTEAVFIEAGENRSITDEREKDKHIYYYLAPLENFDPGAEEIPTMFAFAQTYTDGKPDSEPILLTAQGNPIEELPIINLGSIKNDPDPDTIPLLGISDIALTIYRKDADLAQAQYLTCNPTLFVFGINKEDMPRVIGSTVAVGIPNPNGRAEYPPTDTSALEHIRNHIQDLFNEAVQYGANLLGRDRKAVESAEALALRKAASGATLVGVVRKIGEAITEILNLAARWSGRPETAEFIPSLDFAEHTLSAQELTALVRTWIEGGISQDTLLDNLREADIVSNEIDNETEKDRIAVDEETRLQRSVDAMRIQQPALDDNNPPNQDEEN